MKKINDSQYTKKRGKQSSQSLGMKQRKKEILKKVNANKSKLKKTPLKMRLHGGQATWKLKSVFFLGSIIAIVLLLPTLIVVPTATGNEYEPDSSENNQNNENELLDDESSTVLSVAVMRSKSEKVEDVPLESYVQGVVASEMPVDEFNVEALKAQALAARTYIVNHLLHKSNSKEGDVSDTVQHQVYKNEDELRKEWGSDFEKNMKKLQEAVTATEGKILTYKDAPIHAAFFSTSNGYTENSEDYWENEVPYLRSVESPWDEDSTKFLDQKTFTVQEVEKLLGIELPKTAAIPIETTRTEGRRIDELHINNHQFTGREVRDKLDLKSSDFTIKQKNNHLIFTTKGFGHGIGMSQYGANGMARNGKSYQDIVKHYYQDVEISTVTDTAPTLVSN